MVYDGFRAHVVYSTSAVAYIMVIMTKKASVRKQKKGFYQTIQKGSKEENCVGDLSILRRISCENRPEAAPPMQHNNTTLMAKF